MRWLVLLALVAAVYSECPSDTTYDSIMDRCYKYVMTPLGFQQAQQFCLDTNGLLIDILNITENMFIAEDATHQLAPANQYWIGLSNLNGQWAWDSGAPLKFTNWAPNQPANGTYLCAVSTVKTGLWSAVPCTNTYDSICAYPAHPTTPKPSPTPAGPKCPSGFVYYDQTNSCYYVGTGAPFWSAESSCVSLGGHLTSIHSAFENAYVMSLTSIGGTLDDKQMTWIGIHYTGSDWIWTDGTPNNYLNWEPGQPSKDKGDQCVELLQDDYKKKKGVKGKWDNQPCNYEMRKFVCKRAPLW